MTPPRQDIRHNLITRLKLRHLRLLLAVASTDSLKAVAARLHISQAAVSKSLGEIESLVETRLFHRGPGGTTLTHAGTIALSAAQNVVGQIERLGQSMNELRDGTVGSVRLAVRTASVHRLIAEVLGEFVKQCPNVEVELLEGETTYLVDQLIEGRLDIICAYSSPLFFKQSLRHMRLTQPQRQVLVGAKNHPLAQKANITPSDLMNYTWCIPPAGTRRHMHFLDAFQRLGLAPPKVGVQSSDLGIVIQLLQSTNLLTIMPDQIANNAQALDRLAVLPFTFDGTLEPVLAVWHENSEHRSAIRQFLDHLLQQAQDVAVGR